MLLVCTTCGAKIRVPESAAGKRVKCPKCAAVLQAPAAGADEAAGVTATPRPSYPDDEPAPRPSRRRRDAEDEDDDRPRRRRDEDEEDDRPRRRSVRGDGSSGLAITALVLGILSLVLTVVGGCCCPIFLLPVAGVSGIAAIGCGIPGLNQGGRGMALTGILLGGGSLVLIAVFGVLVLVFGGLNFAAMNMNQPPPNFKF